MEDCQDLQTISKIMGNNLWFIYGYSMVHIWLIYIYIWEYLEVSIVMGVSKMDGLCHGKSHPEMDDLGISSPILESDGNRIPKMGQLPHSDGFDRPMPKPTKNHRND